MASSATWGCGYAAPTPRMQYSAASFASPALDTLHGAVRTEARGGIPLAFFPQSVERRSVSADRVEASLYRGGAAFVSRQLAGLRALHRPRLQQYLLYMFVTLVLLLSWAARLVQR